MKKSSVLLLIAYLMVFETAAFANTKQGHFRWRNDDGNESTATYRQAEDANDTLTRISPVRIRMEIVEASNIGSIKPRVSLYYSTDSVTFTKVPSTPSTEHWAMSRSSQFENGSGNVNALTVSSPGGFIYSVMNEVDQNKVISATQNSSMEYEMSIVPTANVINGTNYYFLLKSYNDTYLDAYDTSPRMLVNLSGASSSTAPATGVGDTMAVLNGVVFADGQSTTVRFLWGTSSGNYTDSVDADQSPVSSNSPTAITRTLDTLSQDQQYYFTTSVSSGGVYRRGEERLFHTRSRQKGSSLLFDGSSYVSAPTINGQGDSITIECWVKWNGTTSADQYIIYDGLHDGGDNASFGMMVDAGNDDKVKTFLNEASFIGSLVLPVGEWTHLAFRYRNGDYDLFFNGNKSNNSGTVISTLHPNATFSIGSKSDGTMGFNGEIEHVRVWNTWRTDDEIREGMFRIHSVGGRDPIAEWTFNENAGTATVDLSSGSESTLNGFDFDAGDGWRTSTTPIGTGIATLETAFSSGTVSLGTVEMTTTENFDSPILPLAMEFGSAPSTLPTGTTFVLSDRYWVLNSNYSEVLFPQTFAVNLTFTVPSSFTLSGTATASNYKLYRRNLGSNGSWTEIATGTNITATSVQFNGITSLGQYALGTNEALPVELISFSALSKGFSVELAWKTATEVNNHGFEVEKFESPAWRKVGFVQGNGSTNTPSEYSFVDNNLPRGKYMYRLKQVDRDGTFEYSPEVEVAVGTVPKDLTLEQNYPNPFNPSTTIPFVVPVSGKATLKVYNAIGQEVTTLFDAVAEAGVYQQAVFNAAHLSSGVYFVRLTSGGNDRIKRLMLMK